MLSPWEIPQYDATQALERGHISTVQQWEGARADGGGPKSGVVNIGADIQADLLAGRVLGVRVWLLDWQGGKRQTLETF